MFGAEIVLIQQICVGGGFGVYIIDTDTGYLAGCICLAYYLTHSRTETAIDVVFLHGNDAATLGNG